MINVIVRELASLESFLDGDLEDLDGTSAARVRRLRPAAAGHAGERGVEEPAGEEVAASMRAAAPPVQSFAMGRRR